MPVDPQASAFLEKADAGPKPPPGSVPLQDFRDAMSAFAPLGFAREELADVTDRSVPREEGRDVPVRVYRPELAEAAPVLVWAHGGSWVRCDLETHDTFLRLIAKRSECVVVSVDYRLSPEARFPDALDDIYAAVRWSQENAEALGGDATLLAVGGDSSGGNLAAAVTLLARERGDVSIAHQTLIVPVLDLTFELPSWEEFGHGYLLTRAQLNWAAEQYAPGVDRRDPLLSPLHADDHARLPPALIVTAEYDPVRDDGEQYAAQLQASDVPVRLVRYPGMIHHAMLVPKAIDLGRRAAEETGKSLGAALAAVRS
jgi:acetyl esterase/lipase